MGIACMQTFHVSNFSENPNSITTWYLDSRPDWAYILAIVLGTLIACYGFLGWWLAERRRLVSRVTAHCTDTYIAQLTIVVLHMVITALGGLGMASLIVFEREILRKGVIIGTLICYTFLKYVS